MITNRKLNSLAKLLLVINVLLGAAHILWPSYEWGQGRDSFFNFENSLTLASWIVSFQLLSIGILALAAHHRELNDKNKRGTRISYSWILVSGLAVSFSIAEATRIHQRLDIFDFSFSESIDTAIVIVAGLAALFAVGNFLIKEMNKLPVYSLYVKIWLALWAFLLVGGRSSEIVPKAFTIAYHLILGEAFLIGASLLLISLTGFVLVEPKSAEKATSLFSQFRPRSFPAPKSRNLLLAVVGGTAFALIFLQIILFRLLTIFGDHITAYSAISIALLGSTIGGVIGYFTSKRAPLEGMVLAALLFPFAILSVLRVPIYVGDFPLFSSLLLMVPFICASTLISIALVKINSHVVYFATLIGSGLGALLVNTSLSHFLEESSLVFLAAFSLVLASLLLIPNVKRFSQILAGSLISFVVSYLLWMGAGNLYFDNLNLVNIKIQRSYPEVELLFSTSSLVSRYDIVRREPGSSNLKAYENGRVIDTIRPFPVEEHQIDPRIPHTWVDNPKVLIIGTSGDGILKSSRGLGGEVYGVEINPAVVDLQTNQLAEFNANSYENVDVAILDGRSYIQQSDQTFDIISLINTHQATGKTESRSPSTEYLFTREAVIQYLDHLGDNGLIVIEEPVLRPRQEPPVWKLVYTLREVLIDQGYEHPEDHFFIFQWRTRTNNYIQIVMKKTPITEAENQRLHQWLIEVDNIGEIEDEAGQRMGPIRAITTLLHEPGAEFSTNYSRIVRGDVDSDFLDARNLKSITDNRPFLFDVDPAQPEIRDSYQTTLIISVVLLAAFVPAFLSDERRALSNLHLFMAVALSGLGYLLIEIVLIQRYSIFLGSPVAMYASVLATLLIFSGLGSLISRNFKPRQIYLSVAAILAFLLLQQWFAASFFSAAAQFSMGTKVALTVLSVAPLGFVLGVPFPYILTAGKTKSSPPTAAALFALNSTTSALAVPMALSLTTSWGFDATFGLGVVIYVLVLTLLIIISRPAFRRTVTLISASAIILFVLSPLMFGGSRSSQSASQNENVLFGISYGHSRIGESLVFADGDISDTISFEWLFWVIQTPDRIILVDTGSTDLEQVENWEIEDYVVPTQQLAEIGILPEDVSDIILTHAHWDHMGDISKYPNAQVWMQQAEYDHVLDVSSPDNSISQGISYRDYETLLRIQDEGRLKLIQGSFNITSKISITLAGGHSPGSQYVTLETIDGVVVIAGDETYMYRNNQSHRVIGSAVDPAANLAGMRNMHQIAASPFLILPGHDPRVMSYFPEIAPGIVIITTIAE